MSEDKNNLSFLGDSERTRKPRTTGINLVVAVYMAVEGMHMLQDLVSWAGDYIDYYKVGNEMRLQSREFVTKRLAFLKEHGIEPYAPGGVVGRAVELKCLDRSLDELEELNISVFEASRVRLTMEQMLEAIQKGRDRGFKVFAEVGKKFIGSKGGPKTYTSTADVIQEMKTCLDAGAFQVIYEFTEIVSLLKEEGGLEKLLEVVGTIGKDNIMLEVPTNALSIWNEIARYVSFFIDQFGQNVNLGNVSVNHVMAVEKIRHNFEIKAVGHEFS